MTATWSSTWACCVCDAAGEYEPKASGGPAERHTKQSGGHLTLDGQPAATIERVAAAVRGTA